MGDELNTIFSRFIANWDEDKELLKELVSEEDYRVLEKSFAEIEKLGIKLCAWSR